jgi:hypothetical protein
LALDYISLAFEIEAVFQLVYVVTVDLLKHFANKNLLKYVNNTSNMNITLKKSNTINN